MAVADAMNLLAAAAFCVSAYHWRPVPDRALGFQVCVQPGARMHITAHRLQIDAGRARERWELVIEGAYRPEWSRLRTRDILHRWLAGRGIHARVYPTLDWIGHERTWGTAAIERATGSSWYECFHRGDWYYFIREHVTQKDDVFLDGVRTLWSWEWLNDGPG